MSKPCEGVVRAANLCLRPVAVCSSGADTIGVFHNHNPSNLDSSDQQIRF